MGKKFIPKNIQPLRSPNQLEFKKIVILGPFETESELSPDRNIERSEGECRERKSKRSNQELGKNTFFDFEKRLNLVISPDGNIENC